MIAAEYAGRYVRRVDSAYFYNMAMAAAMFCACGGCSGVPGAGVLTRMRCCERRCRRG